mmetsp:Transcript_11318/g.22772  ORF Transcript_11318/g.22772 Transcript_11318/m.22772 type:complete len:173 (-) Transcript_11318:2265-2783(-)
MLKDLVKKCEVGQWSGSMRVALDDMVKSFNDAMTQAMECCVPLVPEKAIAEERCLEAAPGRERRRARKMLHKWNRKVRKHEQHLRTKSWRNFCDGFRDQRQLYALFKRSQGGSSVPPFEDLEGNMCSSDIEKAEGFNEAYAKIGNEPDGENKVGARCLTFSAQRLLKCMCIN